MKPPLPECEECGGYGYDVFNVDRADLELEIERADVCDCLAQRLEKTETTDDDAAVAFVRDLEAGLPYARERALWLLHGLPGSEPLPCEHCGSLDIDNSGPIVRCDNCKEEIPPSARAVRAEREQQ